MGESSIKIFQTENGKTEIQVVVQSETVWLSQKQMADLFEKDSDTIGLHLRNIYKSGELIEKATTEKYSVVQKEGNRNVTRTVIKKRIGDSITEYNLQSIKRLELERHIPSVTAKDSKSGYFSYILRIIFDNSSTESLVVSDKPIDRRQNLSIVETMKTLKKIIQPDIRIIS